MTVTALAGTALAVSDGEVVNAGRHASVHALDRRLPRMPLERWLERLTGGARPITWEANDCGEQCGCPADSGRNIPMCAQASMKLADSTEAVVLVVVGGVNSGLAAKPELWQAYIARADSLQDFRRLYEFGQAVRRGLR